jgi:hypothetical protein
MYNDSMSFEVGTRSNGFRNGGDGIQSLKTSIKERKRRLMYT